MNTNTLEFYLKNLDDKDRDKLLKLAKELYKQKKYKKLRQEIEERRQEISEGKVLSHEEVWKWALILFMQKVLERT